MELIAKWDEGTNIKRMIDNLTVLPTYFPHFYVKKFDKTLFFGTTDRDGILIMIKLGPNRSD